MWRYVTSTGEVTDVSVSYPQFKHNVYALPPCSLDPEDGDSMVHRNAGKYLPVDSA